MDAAAAEASIDAVCTQARSHLVALIHSGALSQAVRVAAELRIAELLTDGPRHVAELAQATETDPSSLHRLLRALVALSASAAGGQAWSNSPSPRSGGPSRWQRRRLAQGLRAVSRRREMVFRLWADLLESVRTGKPRRAPRRLRE